MITTPYENARRRALARFGPVLDHANLPPDAGSSTFGGASYLIQW